MKIDTATLIALISTFSSSGVVSEDCAEEMNTEIKRREYGLEDN